MLVRVLSLMFALTAGALYLPMSAGTSEPPAVAVQEPESDVAVPEPAAALVRPILDLQQESIAECGAQVNNPICATGDAFDRQQDREERIWELVVNLSEHAGGPHVDEAFVVLACFRIEVANEVSDAIIDRGPAMLPLISKYRHHRPVVPRRSYPSAMLRGDADDRLDAVARLIDYGSIVRHENHGELREVRALIH